MSARTLDAIVIGAGVNGLVAAHTLARAGRRVLVLERQSETEGALDVGWVPPHVIAELQLDRSGGGEAFRIERPDPWMTVALPQGGRLELWQDPSKTAQAIRQLSAADAGKWAEFCRRMSRLAGVLERIYQAPPPDVETTDPGELLRLAGLGLRVRGMGKQGMIDLLRILPMSVAELLDDWFENDTLKAVLGAAGVLHLKQGPRSGGTAFNFLHHHVGSPPGVFRPPLSNLSQVLARLTRVEVRRNASVARVTVREGRAIGVVLANGEEIAAPLVLSSADPRSTLLGLVDPAWLDPEFVRAVRSVKCRGVAARVTLLLDRQAGFTTFAVAPSLDYLERAYDDAKYGRVSRHPWLEARAEDRRVVVHAQYFPHALADGRWDEARRGILGDVVVALLAQHLPALQGVTGREVLAPPDLEARYGVTEGHLYHGEHTLDQILFMRPVPGWGQYRTPVRGLYLCGAGTHPGGAIAGGPGRNAARAVLKDGGKGGA